MNKRFGLAVAAVLALGAGGAQAAPLLVDFNDRGAAAATQSGWNSFVFSGGTNDGVTTSTARTYGDIDVTVSRVGTGSHTLLDRDRGSTNPPAAGTFTQTNLMRDYINADNTTAGLGLQILIEGLEPNATYSGRIWSYDDGHYNLNTSANFKADWSVNGTQFANDISLSGPRPTANLDYSYGFTAIADGTGSIVIQGVRDAASVGNSVLINGFELDFVSSPVPEPTSVGLLGLGALRLLARRRSTRTA